MARDIAAPLEHEGEHWFAERQNGPKRRAPEEVEQQVPAMQAVPVAQSAVDVQDWTVSQLVPGGKELSTQSAPPSVVQPQTARSGHPPPLGQVTSEPHVLHSGGKVEVVVLPSMMQPHSFVPMKPHDAPAAHPPAQPASPPKYWHGSVVVVVVVVIAQPPIPQASQQLVNTPTHAEPPLGATHFAGSRLIEHLVTPVLVVRQQVTKPGLPQVERDAHFLTNLAQLLLVRTASACCSAQRT